MSDRKDSNREGEECSKKRAGLSSSALAAILLTVVDVFDEEEARQACKKKKNIEKGKVICRRRRTVSSVMNELGNDLSRRYFRMERETFFKLPDILRSALLVSIEEDKRTQGKHNHTTPKKRNVNKENPPNGAITTEIRLAAALRYFAGGCALDIALVFGINHWDVF